MKYEQVLQLQKFHLCWTNDFNIVYYFQRYMKIKSSPSSSYYLHGQSNITLIPQQTKINSIGRYCNGRTFQSDVRDGVLVKNENISARSIDLVHFCVIHIGLYKIYHANKSHWHCQSICSTNIYQIPWSHLGIVTILVPSPAIKLIAYPDTFW